MENFVLQVYRKLRLLLLIVLTFVAHASVALAGIMEPEPGVVPEPTSALIWLGLTAVIAAATGRRSRRQ